MKRLAPLTLALSLAYSAAQAGTFSSYDDASLQVGQQLMQSNGLLLRNGDNVWKRIREGYQLTEVDSELVRRHERMYSAKPEYLKRTLTRGQRYLFHIMNEVERRGMPTEIALLPLVESAFNPTAVSGAKAAGLWQFMPATGRHYGLEQTFWYDGRRDVLGATNAALDYLENLYAMFGDWNLALASYNWGEGNVSRALERNRAKGLPETFEAIRMPNETRNYVPKLLAVRNILAEPERFGLKLDKFDNRPYFVAVSTGKHMDIDVAAKLAGMSLDEFKALNPAFNRPIYAHKPGRQLLVPASKAELFEKNLAEYREPLLSWQVYTAQSGDNIDELAQRHGMSVERLRNVNGLASNSLAPGQPLLLAALSSQTASPAPAALNTDVDTTPDTYVSPLLTANAGAGAAVERLAQADKPATADSKPAVVRVSADSEAKPRPATVASEPARAVQTAAADANGGITRRVSAVLTPSPAVASNTVASSADTPATSRHTVAPGDTLYNISRRYNLSVAELKTLNQLDGEAVKLGQTLAVKLMATAVAAAAPSASPAKADKADKPEHKEVRKEYVVQRGDTLFSIARKFNIDHDDLKKWNPTHALARLQPGFKLTLWTSSLR